MRIECLLTCRFRVPKCGTDRLAIFISNFGQFSRIDRAFFEVPDEVRVVIDRFIGRKLAHPRNIMERHLSPAQGGFKERFHLLLRCVVGGKVIQYKVVIAGLRILRI